MRSGAARAKRRRNPVGAPILAAGGRAVNNGRHLAQAGSHGRQRAEDDFGGTGLPIPAPTAYADAG